MKISVIETIGINIDDNYKWKNSLVLDKNVSSTDEKKYEKCKKYIEIIYNTKIDYSDARKIDGKIYGCNEYIYDDEKKAKIYFKDNNTCIIETNQEANEWIMIMLNIMLLKENYSLIHAAAVSNQKGALLMPSWGGVGKTASVAKLVRKGYKLLGDDINIITENGEIYPFPKKFILYFYHKDLFPDVFSSKGPKCGGKINQFYEIIKPTIKKILRCIPGLLAYARKHNPQSIKVSPVEIFGQDVIGEKTNIKQIMWLERNKGENGYNDIDVNELASKAVSVTLNEIFGDNIQTILIMSGFNQINFTDTFERMFDIYKKAFANAINGKLNISKEENVSIVADEVIKNIKY